MSARSASATSSSSESSTSSTSGLSSAATGVSTCLRPALHAVPKPALSSSGSEVTPLRPAASAGLPSTEALSTTITRAPGRWPATESSIRPSTPAELWVTVTIVSCRGSATLCGGGLRRASRPSAAASSARQRCAENRSAARRRPASPIAAARRRSPSRDTIAAAAAVASPGG